MSLFNKLFTKKRKVSIPYNCFCAVFNKGRFVEIIEAGEHSLPEHYHVTPPISFDPQTIIVGHPHELRDGSIVFYKLTVQYKITDPYFFIMNADKGKYVIAHAADLMHPLLWNAKTKAEADAILSKGFQFSGRIAEVVFESASNYGARILSASCTSSSLEEILSVPHVAKDLDVSDENVMYIRGYFYNSTGLSDDDIP